MMQEDISEMKEMSYKGFKVGDENVRASNGELRCPYCACKDRDYDYTSLLQHAIRVSEGSLSVEQRAKHSAMARYLAIDLSNQSPQIYSDEEWVPPKRTKRSTSVTARKNNPKGKAICRATVSAQEVAIAKREMNVLITKERVSNDEVQGVRKELIKGLSESGSNHGSIGIKRIGELDHDVFINELVMRMPPGDIVIKGIELCTLWQEKIKDPHWYPFQIIEDASGKHQRLIKEDDLTLQSLKDELGEEIHNMVVDALTEYHNSSGCYMAPELWNFREKRKASLQEVIRFIFKLPAVKQTPKPRKQTKG
ncbi:factor of DNA methylation 1-like [Salvia divinorum]|uniref:Factor of DNA methylation 1-like n=1 Tax=Salvia divinorum TaxID=28513 RepID=A0ABD1I6Q2_SALDI